jgi:hypothetical protein
MSPDLAIGLPVQATDGEAGRINDVLVDQESGEPRYLVVQGHGFFGSDVVLPATAIAHVADGRVFVGLTRREVSALPTYHGDQYGSAQGLVSQTATSFDRHERGDDRR